MRLRNRPRSWCGALVAAVALAAGPAHAASSWQVVATGTTGSMGERIEIDRARIARQGDVAWAWSRVHLGRAVADPSGTYNAIEALNRYDCATRRFTTLHRVYLSDKTAIRDEAAIRNRANAVQVGSLDERLFNLACKPGMANAQRAVEVAGSQAAAFSSEGQPDGGTDFIASLQQRGNGQVLRVADAHDAAAATPKPRMIELPALDKEALAREAAAAGVALPPGKAEAVGKPAAAAKPADPHAVAAAAAAAHSATAPAAPAAKPVPVASKAAPAPEFGVTGHARELMLATSGPVRAKPAKKKEPAKDEHNPAQDMHAHWGYDGAGAPNNWAKLKPEYATCDTGKRQSPIDIRPGIAVDLAPIKINYQATKYRVYDNGHTVQVNVGPGSYIEVMGKRYDLLQFHFHKPSEERVGGQAYPMVIHFVHKDYDDNLAVIAVLLSEGAENAVIQQVWNNIPLEKESEVLAGDVLEPAKLLPENRAYWTYMGSLTTPPCSENVLWMVMKTPTPVSPEQIAIFGRLYKNNARPVQPANGRLIKESR